MLKNKLALLLLLANALISFASCSSGKPVELHAVTLKFTHSEWPEQVNVVDSEYALADLKQEWHLWQTRSDQPANQEPPSYCLEVRLADERRKILLTHDLRLFNEGLDTEYLPPPKTRQWLTVSAERLNNLRFGELLSWQETSSLLPRYSSFTLMDLETGLTWKAQRRAGSRHADIQPLTKQDTDQLKAAYGGAWSWNRRAVVIIVGDKRIAASINGMPHGAGALKNSFPGHHCLHLWQSTTHTKSKPDPAHQVMVCKAAGKLHSYLISLQPTDLQLAMLEIAGQGETDIVRLGILNPPDGKEPSKLATNIKNIRIWDSHQVETTDQKLVNTYNVSICFQGDGKEYRKLITVTSRYYDHWGRWLIDPDFLTQLVK